MQLHPCTFAGWQQPDAPRARWVQGLAAHDRELAREQVRMALRDGLARELGCTVQDLHISNARNQAPQVRWGHQWLHGLHCSISHAQGLALLAWHWHGAVGVDLQSVDASLPRSELQAVAALYLDKNKALSLSGCTQDAMFFELFAQEWCWQEARLKCAGLGLLEWSESLERQLKCQHSAALTLMDGSGAHKAAIAWCG